MDYDALSMRGMLGGVAGGVTVATLSSSPAAAILIGSLAGVLGTVISDVVRAAGRFLVSWFRARTARQELEAVRAEEQVQGITGSNRALNGAGEVQTPRGLPKP